MVDRYDYLYPLDLWGNSSIEEQERDTFKYIIELRDKLNKCVKTAAKNVDMNNF